jgi:hygromycin-B 4-O-kinase
MLDTVSVIDFLQSHFNLKPSNVTRIGAGMFSQVFSFKIEQQAFVIRLNTGSEDFQKDVFAHQHFSSKLPIPKIIQWGRFNQQYYFAIAQRCVGNTLNTLEQTALETLETIVPHLFETLYALQSFDTSNYSGWGLTDAFGHGRFASWEEYLLSFYNQKFAFTWEQLFDLTCMEREVYNLYFSAMQEYVPFCATDKYWVHGDYGFDNVMSCGKRITGVLDWAESRLGDYVYDIAYLAFWSRNIPYKDLWQPWAERKGIEIDQFDKRMICYFLHIGLGSLAIAAIRDDLEDYIQVKVRMQTVTQRSP